MRDRRKLNSRVARATAESDCRFALKKDYCRIDCDDSNNE